MSDMETLPGRRRGGQEKRTRRQLKKLLEASRKQVLALQVAAADKTICEKCGAKLVDIHTPPLRPQHRVPPLLSQGIGRDRSGGFVFVDSLTITAISGELIMQLDTAGHWTTQMVRLRISSILYTDSCGIALVTPGGEIVTDEDHIGVASLTAVVLDQANNTSHGLVC